MFLRELNSALYESIGYRCRPITCAVSLSTSRSVGFRAPSQVLTSAARFVQKSCHYQEGIFFQNFHSSYLRSQPAAAVCLISFAVCVTFSL